MMKKKKKDKTRYLLNFRAGNKLLNWKNYGRQTERFHKKAKNIEFRTFQIFGLNISLQVE